MSIQISSKSVSPASIEVVFYLRKTPLFPSALNLSEGEKTSLLDILQKTTDGPYGDGDFADVKGRLFILLDVAKEKALSRLENLRCAAFRLSGLARKRHFSSVLLNLTEASPEDCSAIIAGLRYGEYSFSKYKSKPKKIFESNFELVAGTKSEQMKTLASQVSTVIGQVQVARNLVNEPGSILTPQQLVAQAVALGKSHGLKVSVKNAAQLQKEGYEGLISVGKGSPNPPALVTLSYQPRTRRPNLHLGLLGKGLTFDTGGISLKPATDMWEMKMDMAGAAAALAGICAISSLKLPIAVTAVLCIAENRPSGHAQLPGDIFTAKNGKTVMVDNTDAEGRLVLTDGLWECGALGVTHLVDLATLTGAVIRALGSSVAGLFTNSLAMGELVLESGQACGEKFWPLPLEREYLEGIQDKVADLKNVSGEVGAISAALFLAEFVPPGIAWAHLDIAGTAFTKKTWKYIEHGATGFGVQSLVEIAKRLSDSARTAPMAPPLDPETILPMGGKHRGRPPKARAASVPPSTLAPKRRGRPPKNLAPQAQRRRGRPPKK
jgi:leucyl aminopeptidase